jgi:hypothetical protein
MFQAATPATPATQVAVVVLVAGSDKKKVVI